MRRLHVGDLVVRIRDEGEGPKVPVLFVHGAGGSSVVWLDALHRLAPHRRVLAIDLPGHGQSDRWPHQISVETYADAVGTACALSHLDRVVLVGHSLGASVCLNIAARWPERVAGLMLVGAAARFVASYELCARVDREFAKFHDWFAKLAWSEATPRAIVERWQRAAFSAEREILQADLAALAPDRFDPEPLMAKIRCPTLVITGADDRLAPPSAAKSLGVIVSARLETVPRAGHMLMLEAPEHFSRILGDFLVTI